ncbi:hypothetical protein H6P81_011522 [Aristolochia fimbriata]|uniref:Uncharacterized protein n=1 Tax=Aristolochia fimbriata TaxID=158543 RepID=A0AAV7EV95_ARIFI|nr:hypothetical protein H6P81_011522 [Aristolochia fimbriata]
MASSSSSYPVQYSSLMKCLLFLVVVCVYASVFACRVAVAQVEKRECLGGRRALLVLDDEFEDIQSNKKKPVVAKEAEEAQLKKKKVVSSGELEVEKPKKKKLVVDVEVEQVAKKKKSVADEKEEEKPKKKNTHTEESEKLKKKYTTAEEQVGVQKSKKKDKSDELEAEIPKKKKSSIAEEEEEADRVPKKKKEKILEEEEEEQSVPKKKKKTTSEEEDELTKKKKKGTIAAEEDTSLKKKKNFMVEDAEEEAAKPKKKKKAAVPEEEDEPKKKKTSAEEVEEQAKKKKITTEGTTVQTNSMKLVKEGKNQTKSMKPSSTTSKTDAKSLDSTSNSYKSSSSPTKKTSELSSASQSKPAQEKKSPGTQIPKSKLKLQTPPTTDDDDEDLITEFRDLTSKFQSDIERISTTSKVYLNKANREISLSFRPLIGSKYASIVASVSPYIFLLLPLIIFPLIYSRIRNFFLPLQTILIFAQIYLSIYFSILSLSYLVTGMEPLKAYYATSKASYVYTQVLQTLGYVLFLLVQVMHLVVVFATKERGTGARLVSLAQMIVGLAVGVHYYVSVAHRAVLREPPRTNWKVHAVYAACFTAVCLLARAERRKKAYLQESGEEGKQS